MPTATLKPADFILVAVNASPVVDLADLRLAMPPRMRGRLFDAAVLRLADEFRIVLSQDCDVASLSTEQLAGYVRDGGQVFTTASPRK